MQYPEGLAKQISKAQGGARLSLHALNPSKLEIRYLRAWTWKHTEDTYTDADNDHIV